MPAFFAHVQKALVCPAERSKAAKLPPLGVGGAGDADDLGGGGGGAAAATQHCLENQHVGRIEKPSSSSKPDQSCNDKMD